MFTFGAVALATIIAWHVSRLNESDRAQYDTGEADLKLLLHVRQDVKLIAFLLGGILVMLGVIADRLG